MTKGGKETKCHIQEMVQHMKEGRARVGLAWMVGMVGLACSSGNSSSHSNLALHVCSSYQKNAAQKWIWLPVEDIL